MVVILPIQSAGELIYDLRVLAGELRKFQLFTEAKRIEAVANELDPNPIKPAPIVPRSISG